MHLTPGDLTADQMLFLVRELNDELVGMSTITDAVELVVVGGAMIAVTWTARGSADIDSIIRLSDDIKVAIANVARKHPGLSSDWLNDHAAAFRLRMDPEGTLWYEGDRLLIYLASPFYVLVMKLFSARTSPTAADVDDVALLMRECGLTAASQLQQLAEDVHRQNISAVRYLPEHLQDFCRMAEVRYEELYGGP